MNKKELVAALAKRTGSRMTTAENNLEALIDIIRGTLKQGGKITLSGFGTFAVRERAARIGRNPRNGKSLQISAAKVPAFKAGGTLKAALNKSIK